MCEGGRRGSRRGDLQRDRRRQAGDLPPCGLPRARRTTGARRAERCPPLPPQPRPRSGRAARPAKTVAVDRLLDDAPRSLRSCRRRHCATSSTTTTPTSSSAARVARRRATATTAAAVVLLDEPVDEADASCRLQNGSSKLLVERLMTRRAAFWTRSVLELSPDGDSVLIPALGRTAQRSVDPTREFGLDGIANLDASRVTRWALRPHAVDRPDRRPRRRRCDARPLGRRRRRLRLRPVALEADRAAG